MTDYKVGDTIKLHGERMNGDPHVFTLTIAKIYPNAYDIEDDSFMPFRSTKGHRFVADSLTTKSRRCGRYFYEVEIVK